MSDSGGKKTEWWFAARCHAYSSGVTITVEPSQCDVCDQSSVCLGVDTSEGEYAKLLICEQCIKQAFAGTMVEPKRKVDR